MIGFKFSDGLHFAVILGVFLSAACGVGEEGEQLDRVRFKLDGEPVDISGAFVQTFVDETKNLGGPNAHLFLLAYQQATSPERLLGKHLEINVTANFGIGEHDVAYTPFPGRNNIWLSYRTEQIEEQWTAYQGTFMIDQIGGPGERFRARFDEIRLINECGQERLLTEGEINVLIGEENVRPEIESELEKEFPDSTAMIENENQNVIFVVRDGEQRVCSFSDYFLQTLPADQSGTDQPEEVFSMTATCFCGTDEYGFPMDLEVFAMDLPATGQGELSADFPPYGAYWIVDREPMDDEIFLNLVPIQLHYQQLGSASEQAVDFRLTEPMVLSFVDNNGVDPNRTLSIDSMHGYGVLLRDCRPNLCQ